MKHLTSSSGKKGGEYFYIEAGVSVFFSGCVSLNEVTLGHISLDCAKSV
jgi:hypothetical protein